VSYFVRKINLESALGEMSQKMPRRPSAKIIFILFLLLLGSGFFAFETIFSLKETELSAPEPDKNIEQIIENPKKKNAVVKPRLPEPVVKTLTVREGDTLMKLLISSGVDKKQAANLIKSLRSIYDVRLLPLGQQLKITFAPQTDQSPTVQNYLQRLSFLRRFDQQVEVLRDSKGQFISRTQKKYYDVKDVFINGKITTSLYNAAIKNGLPLKTLMELIRIFSFDVDFQREIREGDSFSVLFRRHFDDNGKMVHDASIDWTAMILGGTTIEYANFISKKGYNDYYDRQGKSVKKTLMRTPIDGARLTSRYGKRRHPVLGYTKMHRGVDFAAPKGTPIMAAGDGAIEAIGRNGNYGKYIRIRHNSTYKTAYGHLSRYKKGLKKGRRVRQGSVIGYVGSTGRSTGPHLHYEVIKNGRKTNPLSVRLPSGDRLKKKDLAKFLSNWPVIDERVKKAGGYDAISTQDK